MHGPQGAPTKKPNRAALPGLRPQAAASEGSAGGASRSATPERAATTAESKAGNQDNAEADGETAEAIRSEESAGELTEDMRGREERSESVTAEEQKESVAAQLEALDLV